MAAVLVREASTGERVDGTGSLPYAGRDQGDHKMRDRVPDFPTVAVSVCARCVPDFPIPDSRFPDFPISRQRDF